MTVYRIKHLPTGMFYCPSREIQVATADGRKRYVKSNLSRNGKLYSKTPSLLFIGKRFYNHMASKGETVTQPFEESQWRIEEAAN
jgi:hypothetical protein